MNLSSIKITASNNKLFFKFKGELTLYNITKSQQIIDSINLSKENIVVIDLAELEFLDSAGSIFIYNIEKKTIIKQHSSRNTL